MRNSPSFQRSGAATLARSLAIVSLATLALTAFADSPRRVPRELADEIEAAVEENVLRTFKVLQEGKQDIPAFERAISKMLVYIRQGSVTNKPPQVLTFELNGYCNPTDNPLWTEFISGLCKTYQKFYDTNPRDSEMHEEVLALMATAIGKAEADFFRDNGSH
ncbi:MAG: hypothetical protein WB696_01325 [Chthoniobacterales bacterium]